MMHEKINSLLIMRHAQSPQALNPQGDFDRRLSETGLQQPKSIAMQLNDLGIDINSAAISSSQRTKETWSLLENSLQCRPQSEYCQKLYNCSSDDLIEVIKLQSPTQGVFLILAHSPSVSESVHYLSGYFHQFNPADLVILRPKDENISMSVKKDGFIFDRALQAAN